MFARDGFAILERFLEADEVRAVESALDDVISSPRGFGLTRAHNSLFPLRYVDGIVRLFLGSESRMDRVRELTGARDLRWLSGYVTIKEPRSPALWWHQDWWCWDHPASFRRAAPQVALLCYLGDTSPRNGALRVLPGSHRNGSALHASLPEAHSDDAHALPPGHAALHDLPDQVTFECRAGDAVLMDYRLLHGTHANDTHVRRDCIHLSFVPSWRDLPRDLRSHLIDHPALPTADELASHREETTLLPRFSGERRTLTINRTPPVDFCVHD
jgi:ectoine hydroxylase-related dioxygenase (phytanoyl-CoA dioxygenase family)